MCVLERGKGDFGVYFELATDFFRGWKEGCLNIRFGLGWRKIIIFNFLEIFCDVRSVFFI